MRNFALALLILVGSSATALAQPKVLVCYGDAQATATNLQTALKNTNAFGAVDIFNCTTGTPTLAQLKMYSAVLMWDNQMYQSRVAMGDVMTDYVDAGGGVVQGMFNHYNNYQLQGKWTYGCITPGANTGSSSLKPAPNDPNSPLVKDVKTMTSQNILSVAALNANNAAVSVWDYINNQTAIARCTVKGRPRVDLNFYPNPTNLGGDWANVIRNALLFVAGSTGALQAMPANVNFPDTGTGAQSNAVQIALSNAGMAQVNITSFTITGNNPGDFVVVNAPNPPLALAPGASVSVSVAFKPTAAGARSGALRIALANNMGNQDVPLSGNGIGPKLTITPNPINTGGVQLGRSTVPVTVTVANAGGGNLTIKGATPGGANVGEFSFSGMPNFPVALGPGASFTFRVGFTCGNQGVRNAQVTLTSDDPNSPNLVIPVVGTCGNPMLTLDVGTMAFGNQRVGVPSAPQMVTITNAGLSDLKVTALSIDGANAGDFSLNKMNLPGTVKAMASERFAVIFKPTALGQRAGRVVIQSDDPQNPTKFVGLLGNGTTSTLAGMPAALDFGNARIYQASKAQTFTVTNTGGDAANVTMISFSGPNAMYFALSNPPALPAKVPQNNGTLAISVVALPLALGPATATLNVVTDDPMKPTFAIPVKVSGVGASIKVTPNYVDFGAVPVKSTPKPITVKLENTGTDVLTIDDLQLDDGMAGVFEISNPPKTPLMIMPKGSLTFDVTFKTDVMMAYPGVIVLTTDDPMAKTVKIPLAGTGASASFSVMPMVIDFGLVPLNASSGPRQITINNTGEAPITISQVQLGGSSQHFQMEQVQTPFTIDGMRSAIINVSFSPVAGGVITGEVTITPMGLTPAKVRLQGTAAVPQLGISPPEVDFGSVLVGQTSEAAQVGLKNGGGSPIRITAITSTDPAFIVDSAKTNLNVMPGEVTTFAVRFAPTAAGMKTGAAGVTVMGGTMPLVNVKLSGVGAAPRGRGGSSGGCAVGGTQRPGWPTAGLLALGLVALALRSRRLLRRR